MVNATSHCDINTYKKYTSIFVFRQSADSKKTDKWLFYKNNSIKNSQIGLPTPRMEG
jgi:hypothetical protein